MHGQFNHVKRTTTSKQAWDILKDIHESRSPEKNNTMQTAPEDGKETKHDNDVIRNRIHIKG